LNEIRATQSVDSSGFLGSTSYTSTIQQTHAAEISEPVQLVLDEGRMPRDGDKLDLGVNVLDKLPSQSASSCLIDWYLGNLTDTAFHKPSIKDSLEMFWLTFGNSFKEPRRRENVQHVAHILSLNSRQQLDHPDDYAEFLESFSGLNTRWEMIGIFFIAFAYAAFSVPEKDLSQFYNGFDRSQVVAEMKGCVEVCIELSEHSLNNLVCNLLFKNLLLESVLKGDSGK